MSGVSDHADRRLDALAFYESEKRGDDDELRAIARTGSPGDLVIGFMSLFASALKGWGEATGVDEQALIDQLRAEAIRLRDGG